jgi:beta-glucuronidase
MSPVMRKLFLISTVILLCQSAYPQANFITNVYNRTSQSLNGKWKYIMDQYETGSIGFAPLYRNIKQKHKQDRVEYSFDLSQTLWVPGSWNSQKEALYYYEGSIWYRRMFDFTPQLKNSRVFIYVGAANYKTKYSFNGKQIGEHEGGFTPFSFEITDKVKPTDNFVILGVSNTRESDYIPAKVTDWYNHGGITRDVKIVEVPQTFIDDYTIYLDKKSLNSKNKTIKGNVTLNGTSYPDKAVIEIPELSIRQEVALDKDGKGTFAVASSKIALWSPENPKLYKIKITAGEDVLTDNVGFRVIDTQGKKILLNGKPIFLRGISIHDENPLRRDRANSMEDARLILTWVKELGCNFARLAHYPHQENIIRLADEMGILLWEELPLYWGIEWKNEKVLAKAKMQFSELIRRDKNRASSIIWSVANETGPSPERNKFLTEVVHHVRSLDSTRLVSAASKKDEWKDDAAGNTYMVSDPIAKELDIISFNEYQGWYGGSPLLCREKNFKIGYEKPVIISEFGGSALQGFYSDSLEIFSEDYQEWMYKENIDMFKRVPGLSGMTPWILVDFQSPLRQLPHVQDGWNRKGLISEKGAKKKAFYVLKNYYDVVDKEWQNY